ncbi:unnamed protein product [Urochloa humidicola]
MSTEEWRVSTCCRTRPGLPVRPPGPAIAAISSPVPHARTPARVSYRWCHGALVQSRPRAALLSLQPRPCEEVRTQEWAASLQPTHLKEVLRRFLCSKLSTVYQTPKIKEDGPSATKRECSSRSSRVRLDHGVDGDLVPAVNDRLDGRYDKEAAKLVLWLGLMCSRSRPEGRPSTRQVCLYLDGVPPTAILVFSDVDSVDVGSSASLTWSSCNTMSGGSLLAGR